MTSKHSQTNPSLWELMLDHMRHNRVLLVLSILGNFLASCAGYLFWSSNHDFKRLLWQNAPTLTDLQRAELMAGYMTSYLQEYNIILQLFILIPGAVLLVMIGFRYLFNRRMVDLYHSMPVTRSKRFLALWLCGFLIWFVPFLAGSLFLLIAGCVRIGMWSCCGVFIQTWIKVTLMLILGFLAVYHLCLVAVFLSGNIFSALMNILFLGLFTIGAYVMMTAYMSCFFDTYTYYEPAWLTDLAMLLSPLGAPAWLFNALFITPTEQATPLLIGTVIVCGVNLGLALLLHEKRPSELAEKGLDLKPLRILFRFLLSLLCGFALALIFCQNTSRSVVFWMLFGGILGFVVAFCITNAVYHASMRELFAHKLQLAVGLVFFIGVSLFCRYDLAGYDRYIAPENTLQGVAIYTFTQADAGHYYLYDGTAFVQNTDVYNSLAMVQRGEPLTTDPAAIQRLLTTLVQENETWQALPRDAYTMDFRDSCEEFYVRVDTSFGSYYRRYQSHISADELIMDYLVSDTYKEQHYPLSTGLYPDPAYIHGFDLNGNEYYITDATLIHSIYTAYQEDFNRTYTRGRLTGRHAERTLYDLDFYFTKPMRSQRGNTLTSALTLQLQMYEDYTATIATLRQALSGNAWTMEDVTIRRLDISFSLQKDTPEEYLGLVPRGEQDDPSTTGVVEVVTSRRYSLTIHDAETLSQLQPYLRIASYGASECADGYVYIGQAYINDNSILRCYIKQGAMPQELVEKLSVGGEERLQ